MTEADAAFLVGLLNGSEEEEYLFIKLQKEYPDLPWERLRYGACERCGKPVGTHYPTVPNVCGDCTTEQEYAEGRSQRSRQVTAYGDILRTIEDTITPTITAELFKDSPLLSKLRSR